MKKYSFLDALVTEANVNPVNNITSTAAMGSLGSLGGSYAGKHVGYLASKLKNRNLTADKVKWSDPVFMSVVKKDLLDAKNNVRLAKEWYESCDRQDRKSAKLDYERAILEYQAIQKDIAERNPERWLNSYKQSMASNASKRFSKAGGVIGAGSAIGGTALALLKANGKLKFKR